MRKNLVLASAFAVAAVFTISACGGGSASPVVTVTKEVAPAPAPAPEPAPVEPDYGPDTSGYIAYLHSQDSFFRAVDNSTSIETGTSVCLALGTGNSVQSIVMAGIDAGLSSNQVATIIVGAVRFLCPQYAGDVQDQVQAY